MKPPRVVLYSLGGLALAALLACLVVAITTPMPEDVPSSPTPGERVGVLHVHTVASDGGGTVDDVERAARKVGLDFVILTDHNLHGAEGPRYLGVGTDRGDGKAAGRFSRNASGVGGEPGPGRAPASRGPLLIVGEEVSTDYGHLVVLGGEPVGSRRGIELSEGPDGAPPPPLVGPGEGFRIAAHPTTRPSWRAWHSGHFDAMEIWNADSDRRTGDARREWIHAVALLPFRPVAALYRLLDHPEEALALWDRELARGPVPGVCAVDAHHRLPIGPVSVPLPSYRQSFTLARQHVVVSAPTTGDARADGDAVEAALAAGRSWCGFDGLADARGLAFEVRSGDGVAGLGGAIPWAEGARLRATLPPAGKNGEWRLVRDGRVAARGEGREVDVALEGPGVYRLEAFLFAGGRRMPWILTNAVRVEGAGAAPPGPTGNGPPGAP